EFLDWMKLIQVLMFLALPFVLFVFGRGKFTAEARRTQRKTENELCPPRPLRLCGEYPILSFALTWLAIEIIGVVMQGRMYAYHFLPLVPPAALLYAMLPWRERVAPIECGLLPIGIISFGMSIHDALHVREV